MGHYFINQDNLQSQIKEFKITIENQSFTFKTDNGVFSKGEIDYGSKLLLTEVLKLDLTGNCLDLGCGYGVLGIILAKIKNLPFEMIDINNRAIHLTKMNIKDNNCLNTRAYVNDGLKEITKKYDNIITNPPIRVGKVKLYELINEALEHLTEAGVLYLVIRKEQGAKSFIKDFSSKAIIEILTKSKGFYILSLKKKS